MSLSSTMLVGFTGIQSNTVGVDTVGDNLANLNTTAFKGQRALFESLLYRTVTEGEAPGPVLGGTNPRQIGSGSGVASLQRSFLQGGIDPTGFPSDLAVDGDGFFLLTRSDGERVYTRDGSFRLDATQTMVSGAGLPLQVFSADDTGQIDTGQLTDLVIPLGGTTPAVATEAVTMNGQLDSGTNVAAVGAVVSSQPLNTANGPADASTALTSLVDPNGLPYFSDGDELRINAMKGGISIPEAPFTVGSTGRSLGDLAQFLEAVLGIQTDPATGGTPGVTVSAGPDPPVGSLVISSNLGEINALSLSASSITNATGAVTSPFQFTTIQEAVGAGVTTSFGVFDSLGNLVDVRLRAVVESKSDTGITWRFYAESETDSDLSPALGTGTITFDPDGQFVAATGTDLSIDLNGSGSATPLAFSLDLTALTGVRSGSSELIMASQDGAPPGVLTGYSIDDLGVVTAAFSNDQTRVLAQVALATFSNSAGLVALSENQFTLGPNSGDAVVGAPKTGTAGAVVSGALERSNVEIAREFVNLIQSSAGISSASRVVRVADELLRELLLLGR